MSAPKHTPGPWRWEINLKHKSLHLVGGKPKFDLTLMDFERWGMGGATVRFRDTAHDGLQILHKLHDRPDWIAPFPGRDHHADWCSDVIHPDARLIAAAPELLTVLRMARESIGNSLQSLIETETHPVTGMVDHEGAILVIESEQDLLNQIDAAIAKATGDAPCQ